MIINRYNYQELFLLYTDNELTVAESKAVEDFVSQNPDLKEELRAMQHSVLEPDEEIIFENKVSLLRFDDARSFIYPGNFEEFAIAYSDGELNDLDKTRLEDFVKKNPDFQEEFDLIQTLKLPADDSIVFTDKDLLYRSENERKPLIFPWWRIAAAAVVLLAAGFLWLSGDHDTPSDPINPGLARIEKSKLSKTADPVAAEAEKGKKSSGHNDIKGGIAPKENLVVAEKEIKHADKNEMLANNVTHKHIEHVERNKTNGDQHNSNDAIASATDRFESPKSSVVKSNSKTATDNIAGTLATKIPSLDITQEEMPERHDLKINAISNTNHTIARTVANVDDDEEDASVSGISTDNKNPLRGILRKASRFIDKNTASLTSKKSGLLIGNIQIAFQ